MLSKDICVETQGLRLCYKHMTIEKLREALGEDGINVTDEEILNQYELLKSICSLVVEDYLKERDRK